MAPGILVYHSALTTGSLAEAVAQLGCWLVSWEQLVSTPAMLGLQDVHSHVCIFMWVLVILIPRLSQQVILSP